MTSCLEQAWQTHSSTSEHSSGNPSTIGDRAESENTTSATIEHLGRLRPAIFRSAWEEIRFVSCIILSQLLTEYFVSGFTVLGPTAMKQVAGAGYSLTWLTSAFCLVVSAFLLPLGRLADLYGGFPVFVGGCAWSSVWSLVNGFSRTDTMMIICRALQGLGAAAMLPAGLTLLGCAYRPGPRKNLVFSLYGAMAPLGFFFGILVAGSVAQYSSWRWYFWMPAVLLALETVTCCFAIPTQLSSQRDQRVKMDWPGSVLTASALILLVFAVTEGCQIAKGWRSPYIYSTAMLGIVVFVAAVYVQGWVAESPLLPFDMFRIKGMCPVVFCLLISFGTIGIFMLYSTLLIQEVIGVEPMTVVAWYAPMAAAGCIVALSGGYIMHLIPMTVLFTVSNIAIMVSSLLLALLPFHASYWAWILPAMVCATISIDCLFNAASVFFSSSLPSRQQGLAGAMANLLLYLSTSILLGLAELVAARTSFQGRQKSYQNAFWFELACGAISLLVVVIWVRVDRAKSEYTVDERDYVVR